MPITFILVDSLEDYERFVEYSARQGAFLERGILTGNWAVSSAQTLGCHPRPRSPWAGSGWQPLVWGNPNHGFYSLNKAYQILLQNVLSHVFSHSYRFTSLLCIEGLWFKKQKLFWLKSSTPRLIFKKKIKKSFWKDFPKWWGFLQLQLQYTSFVHSSMLCKKHICNFL